MFEYICTHTFLSLEVLTDPNRVILLGYKSLWLMYPGTGWAVVIVLVNKELERERAFNEHYFWGELVNLGQCSLGDSLLELNNCSHLRIKC